MTANNKQPAVIGIFRSREAADKCFDALIRSGYLSSDINIMMTDRTRRQHYAVAAADSGDGAARPETAAVTATTNRSDGAGNKSLEGAGVGGSIGAIVGATVSAIAAVGTTLVIPGLNLIVAGPIMAALAGGSAGALAGGLVGGLVGLGIPEEDALAYYRALQEGSVVMSVEGRPNDAHEIRNLMIQFSGERVCCCNC